MIAVWRAWGLDLLLSPLLEVLAEPVQGLFAVLGGCTVLLADLMPILSYLIHTQFDYSLQNVQILVDVHPEALGGAVQGNDVALVDDEGEDHHVGKKLGGSDKGDICSVCRQPSGTKGIRYKRYQ